MANLPPGITLDVGNLAAFDERPLDPSAAPEEAARQAAEALVHSVFSLPLSDDAEARLVTLPSRLYPLPREKPIPRERSETKWEQFAREKGIHKKKKRDRLVLDETTGEYIPRYGRGSKNAADRDVVLPHKESEGDNYNPFHQKRKEKRERVKTNVKQQRANVARSQKKVNPMQALDLAKRGASGRKYMPKSALRDSLAVVQKSTASAGHFDDKVKNEPKQKIQGRKKKHQAVGGKDALRDENQRISKIADRILKS